MAALNQGAPGQMTWLEDSPPWLWLRPAYCFASVMCEQKIKNMIPYLTALFYFDSEIISGVGSLCADGRRLKRSSTFMRKRVQLFEKKSPVT